MSEEEETYDDEDFEEEEEVDEKYEDDFHEDDVNEGKKTTDSTSSSFLKYNNNRSKTNNDASSLEEGNIKAGIINQDENDNDDDGVCVWEVADIEDCEFGTRIGGGGFAIVYEGYWKNKHVAFKTLFDPRVDEKLKREFMDELHVMSSLSHPNIVELFAVNVKPPKLFFIMELCDRSLYQLLHLTKEHISIDKLIHMATGFASGMQYLHGKKPSIIHRDIKSQNILLTIDWKIKLCDFGLVTTKVTTAGTPAYMAPELLKNKPFSKEVDVYAFGIVLWEMFSREVPWNAMDPRDIITAVGNSQRPDIPRYDCPDFIQGLIETCWAQNASVRPTFNNIFKRLSEWTPPVSHIRDSVEGFGDCLEDLLKK
jgi:serine/threonine protein kinase